MKRAVISNSSKIDRNKGSYQSNKTINKSNKKKGKHCSRKNSKKSKLNMKTRRTTMGKLPLRILTIHLKLKKNKRMKILNKLSSNKKRKR